MLLQSRCPIGPIFWINSELGLMHSAWTKVVYQFLLQGSSFDVFLPARLTVGRAVWYSTAYRRHFRARGWPMWVAGPTFLEKSPLALAIINSYESEYSLVSSIWTASQNQTVTEIRDRKLVKNRENTIRVSESSVPRSPIHHWWSAPAECINSEIGSRIAWVQRHLMQRKIGLFLPELRCEGKCNIYAWLVERCH